MNQDTKLFGIMVLLAISLMVLFSVVQCSSEEDTTLPPSIVITPKPEPEPEPTPAPTQYTLTVTAGEGGTVSTVGGIYDEGTEVRISTIADSCFNFSQWSDGDTSQERTVILKSDIEINAEFELNTNEIEFSMIKLKYPCAYKFELDKPFNETEKYKVLDISWLSASVFETHAEYYYPTNVDYHSPGYFYMDPANFAYGDFNNDGLQDVVITWAIMNHTLERNSRYNYSILINNGDGSMTYDHDAITSSSAHYNHFAYRTKVADFNGDGLDDIVSASMGVIQRIPGQASYTRWERIPLLLNIGDGKFVDASSNIEGQEDGISPPHGYSFGHELSVGDVDGDGDVDIYSGKVLLLNDGNGFFKNETSKLLDQLKPNRNLWSSVIADFNNDGIDDFFIPYAEPAGWQDYKSFSIFYSISKNNKPSYSDSYTGFLSDAKYGIENTKMNDAIAYDINLDGYKDVIIGVTRADPYYQGKGLQVFLNTEDVTTGSRKFVNSDHLLPDESIFNEYHGEGNLNIFDINNDGILDIVHSGGGSNNNYALAFYLNNGGSLELYDINNFAYINQTQIPDAFSENYWEVSSWPPLNKLMKAIPINLDNQGWIDYISYVELQRINDCYSPYNCRKEIILYSVIAKD